MSEARAESISAVVLESHCVGGLLGDRIPLSRDQGCSLSAAENKMSDFELYLSWLRFCHRTMQ